MSEFKEDQLRDLKLLLKAEKWFIYGIVIIFAIKIIINLAFVESSWLLPLNLILSGFSSLLFLFWGFSFFSPLLMKYSNFIQENIIESDENSKFEVEEYEREENSLYLWKPELIEWIGKENDPVKLAVASCIIGDHWPEWMPGMPENYNDKSISDEEQFFSVQVIKLLEDKSESLAPGLLSRIRSTHHYVDYKVQ